MVSLSISRRFFLEALRLMYECACTLFDLSYSPNLALTLVSACMRGARAHACSHTSPRDSKKSRRLILNNVLKPMPSEVLNNLDRVFTKFLHH